MTQYRKKILSGAAIFVAALIIGAVLGATLAYVHIQTETLVNVITLGDVDIDLMEPNWKPDNGKDVPPNGEVPKDPVIKNVGSLDAWVFMKVENPVGNAILVHGTKDSGPIKTELFTFTADSTNWELLQKNDKGNIMEYIYGYKKILQPGDSTPALFQKVKAVNYLEGSLDTEATFTIPVKAEAIQTDVCPKDATLADVYQEFLKETAKNAN